jgi:hypothetical protein
VSNASVRVYGDDRRKACMKGRVVEEEGREIEMKKGRYSIVHHVYAAEHIKRGSVSHRRQRVDAICVVTSFDGEKFRGNRRNDRRNRRNSAFERVDLQETAITSA